jgi:hypothetical protein
MQLVYDYHGMIDWIVARSGESDKFVHVQVGLIIWSMTALVTGRQQGSALPLAVVFLAEIGNEIMDRLYLGNWNWPDTVGDAAATWAWPILLSIFLSIQRAREESVAEHRPTLRIPEEEGGDEAPPLRSIG